MKKNKKIIFLIVFLLCVPINVFAYVWSGGVAGVGGYVSGCSNNNYCYSMVGLRFSLYKYTGTSNAIKVGRSHDYWKTEGSNGSEQNHPKTTNHVSSKGRFSSLDGDSINDKKNGTKIYGASKFSVEANTYKNYGSEKVTYLDSSKWKWDYRESGENSKFLDWMSNTTSNAIFQTLDEFEELKKNFALTDAEANDIRYNKEKYYLVAETLFGVWVGNNSSLPSGEFQKSRYYVGTLYELNAFTTKLGSLQLYAEGLYVSNQIGDFVGTTASSILKISTSSDVVNQEYIKKNNAIGLGVFKLEDVIQVITCKDVCGVNPSVDCSANYCKNVEGRNTLSSVKDCMRDACGLSEPAGYSCGSTCPVQSSKDCPISNENTIETCSSLNGGYLKISCSDKQKVTPSNDLPSIFYKGTGGFNYSVNINGSKTCKLFFNKDKYYYNKKAAVTTAENNSVEEQKNKYINFDFNDYMYKNDKYDMNLTVQGETVPLNEIQNQTQIKVTTNNGYRGTTVQSIDGNNPQKKITASIYSKYEVPQACYSLKTGKVIRTNILSGCGDNKLENIGYYAFYIGAMNIQNVYPSDYNTTLTIKKENYVNNSRTQVCTLGTNKCNFTVREDTISEKASCSIYSDPLIKIGNEYKTTVYIKANNRGSEIATCKLNGSIADCNNGFASITLNENDSKTVQGSVTYDGVTVNCNTVITSPGPSDLSDPRCTEQFSKTNKNVSYYADIRDYCNQNWKIDKDNYSSASDCYNKCTQIPGVCKTTYKCSDKTGIQSYCNLNWQNDGYKSIEMCVNDCSCSGDDPSALDFIYRPIAVGGNVELGYNAFPNRSAGSNWTGYESYTEYDNFDKAPIYVIELDEESIKNLKNDTRGDISNYVDYDGELEDNSYYKSELIERYRGSIFVCVNGSGRCN